MMRGRWHVYFMVMLATASTGGVLRDPLHEATRQGKECYDRAQYPQALEAFGRGRAENPNHPVLAFNIGDALLAMGKSKEAQAEYRKALATADRRLKARTMYNLGNAHAVENDWPAAAAAYRESLILDPAQKDAKRNLELTIRKIKEQEESQRQQRGEKQDQSGQQSSGEPGANGQNQPDSKNERQPSKQSERQTDRSRDPENDAAQNRQFADRQAPGSPSGENKQEQQPAGESAGGKNKKEAVPVMNPVQALQLLQALEKQEKKELLRMQQSQARKRPKSGRDW
ncbi:MAG TPA: hypothetical protein PKN61_00105 [Acidobacteriota bacterium]|nr:hypothetical protein [Acidobacteriota bacterium]HNT99606.1 hypothetical protein [Acidobacteriota bacterium]HQP72439.1 hypothetical protein [Acidobacteriota bacterium]